MPVTTRVAPVEVKRAPTLSTFNPTSLLQQVCPKLGKGGQTSVLDSSFQEVITVKPTRDFGDKKETANGFVGTILDAYRQHNHVVLRPEDVWFAILIQFSFYVNNHAEKMREHFVDHAGKKKLEILQDRMDIPAFIVKMTDLLHQNIKDPKFRDWIMPDFTTSTETDRVTASIIMMGTMQKYFVYFMGITCGIPSVTLLGEENDWQNILNRIDFLSVFSKDHPELAAWQSVLKAIVSNMVQTFKAPDSPDVVRFWQRAVHSHVDDYSGDKLITGWILGFCFWDTEGKLLDHAKWSSGRWEKNVAQSGHEWWFQDELCRSTLAWNEVPSAFSHVPIHVKIDSGMSAEKFIAKAVAGSVGYTVRDSEDVFKATRNRGKRSSGFSGETLTALTDDGSDQKPSILKQIAQKLLCFKSNPQYISAEGDRIKPVQDTPPPLSLSDKPPSRSGGKESAYDIYEIQHERPQLSDLTELNEHWAYEKGGKNDTLQPVTGWSMVRTSEGTYGEDPDVPEVQFDSDADDYDEDLALNGRPSMERGEL